MNRRTFLRNTAQAIVGVIASQHAVAADYENRPNIVLIMADDMGWSDAGCYGGEIQTPNLDRLAREGLRFSQFYNGARCVPTRASLIYGVYPQQAGARNVAHCISLAEAWHATPEVPPGPVDSYRTVDLPWANASNTPFRRFKMWLHEGGIATPLIVRWPGSSIPRSTKDERSFRAKARASYPCSRASNETATGGCSGRILATRRYATANGNSADTAIPGT